MSRRTSMPSSSRARTPVSKAGRSVRRPIRRCARGSSDWRPISTSLKLACRSSRAAAGSMPSARSSPEKASRPAALTAASCAGSRGNRAAGSTSDRAGRPRGPSALLRVPQVGRDVRGREQPQGVVPLGIGAVAATEAAAADGFQGHDAFPRGVEDAFQIGRGNGIQAFQDVWSRSARRRRPSRDRPLRRPARRHVAARPIGRRTFARPRRRRRSRSRPDRASRRCRG